MCVFARRRWPVAIVLLALALALAGVVGCYDYDYAKDGPALDPAKPESTQIDGDWALLSDGSALAATQGFYHARFGAAVPTPSSTHLAACEPSMPCHLWIDDVPDTREWEQVALTNTRVPVTYDMIVYAPTSGVKSHVAIVDHVEGSTIFVMDADAHDDLRRSVRPHAWRGTAYGWFHLRKLDAAGSESNSDGGTSPTRSTPQPYDSDAGGAPTTTPTPTPTTPAPTSSCVTGGYYCGGNQLVGATNQLYRCNGIAAAPTLMARCANGCNIGVPGTNDACSAPTACVVGGDYCGGDKINGEPDVLYDCGQNGAITIISRCAKGCAVRPGMDDVCNP